MNLKVILASTSCYRRQLLAQLGIPFEVRDPGVAETIHKHEKGDARALRLAKEKCQAVAKVCPDAVVIGSDQVGVCAGRVLHKPGDKNRTIRQLQALSGHDAQFYTAVAVSNPSTGEIMEKVVVTSLKCRLLTRVQIENYVDFEAALDCAGGFKIEAGGIGLFERVSSDDPSALPGLPLVTVVDFLIKCGISIWQGIEPPPQ